MLPYLIILPALMILSDCVGLLRRLPHSPYSASRCFAGTIIIITIISIIIVIVVIITIIFIVIITTKHRPKHHECANNMAS